MARRSRVEAEQTRMRILDHAMALGSVEGLEALTIGRLAEDLELSKSGVIGHFGSKEQLQIDTVHAGIASFVSEVWQPVSELKPGIAQLEGMMDSWLSYLEREVFPGGCFLTAVAIEFDDRPGAVKTLVQNAWRRWLKLLADEVELAQAAGDLRDDLDPNLFAFRLHAYVTQATSSKQLFGDAAALQTSRAAIADLLAGPAIA